MRHIGKFKDENVNFEKCSSVQVRSIKNPDAIPRTAGWPDGRPTGRLASRPDGQPAAWPAQKPRGGVRDNIQRHAPRFPRRSDADQPLSLSEAAKKTQRRRKQNATRHDSLNPWFAFLAAWMPGWLPGRAVGGPQMAPGPGPENNSQQTCSGCGKGDGRGGVAEA